VGSRLLDLRLADVNIFLAVHRAKSVPAAARAVGLTTGQVSKSIARLEALFGGPLFFRGKSGVVVSDRGHALVAHFQELIERVESAQRGDPSVPAVLTVSAPTYLCGCLLPEICAAHDDLLVRTLEVAPALVRAYAAGGFFDVAFTLGRDRFPEAWSATNVGRLRLGLLGSPALAKQLGPQPLAEDRVRKLPFISPSYVMNGELIPVEDSCPLPRKQRRLGTEVQTIGLGLELAARTEQVIFGPLLAARHHLGARRLVELRVDGWADAAGEEIYVVCNADRVSGRLQRSLAEVSRRALDNIGD
jgi:DNA-binding transcriptional LysR family regulator